MTPVRFEDGRFHAYTATSKRFERTLATFAEIQGHVLPGFSYEPEGMRFKLGDFAVTHANDGTKYTFQIPSSHDFDFHAEVVAAGLDKPESERDKV